MATCKHCARNDLEWFNAGSEANKAWKLVEPGGELHRCLKNGTQRLGGVYTMIKAMTAVELANVIGAASRELMTRATDAEHKVVQKEVWGRHADDDRVEVSDPSTQDLPFPDEMPGTGPGPATGDQDIPF